MNLGSVPLCCIGGFSWTKLNLTPTTFTMVRRCMNREGLYISSHSHPGSQHPDNRDSTCIFSIYIQPVYLTLNTLFCPQTGQPGPRDPVHYSLHPHEVRSKSKKLVFKLNFPPPSCELSKVDPTTSVHTFLTTLQSISWLAGIWGLQMLGGLVGDSLASTEWSSR